MSAGLHWTEAKLGVLHSAHGSAKLCTNFVQIGENCQSQMGLFILRKDKCYCIMLFVTKNRRHVGLATPSYACCNLQVENIIFVKIVCKVLRQFCTQWTFWLLQLKRKTSKILSQETGWRWQKIQNTRQVRNTARRKKLSAACQGHVAGHECA